MYFRVDGRNGAGPNRKIGEDLVAPGWLAHVGERVKETSFSSCSHGFFPARQDVHPGR